MGKTITSKVKCNQCGFTFDLLAYPEDGMGYVNCPKCKNPVTQADSIGRFTGKEKEMLTKGYIRAIVNNIEDTRNRKMEDNNG